MSNYIVTISRQFGSLGRSIAAKLAERMEIDYLDRDIVEETSKRMNMPVSEISDAEESMGGSFVRRAYPLGVGNGILKDTIFDVQKSIIEDFAREGSGIVVGRCADYILKDYPNLLSVYIYASVDDRIKNCEERLGMNKKIARKMMSEVDTARENYHRTYIPGYKSPFDGRDICIDSGSFGVEGTVDILEGIIRRKFISSKKTYASIGGE